MRCSKCEQDKDTSEFHRQGDGYFPWCKACRKEYDREYHKKRWASGKKKLEIDERKQRNREFLWDYLSKNPCAHCGEEEIILLQFDHLRDKKYNVSEMVSRGHSIEAIKNEIAKCQVLCAHCHIRKTAKEENWYIYRAVAQR